MKRTNLARSAAFTASCVLLVAGLLAWSGCSDDRSSNSTSLLAPDKAIEDDNAVLGWLRSGEPYNFSDPKFLATPEGNGSNVLFYLNLWDSDYNQLWTPNVWDVQLYLGETDSEGNFTNAICGANYVTADYRVTGYTGYYRFPIAPIALKGDLGTQDYHVRVYHQGVWHYIYPNDPNGNHMVMNIFWVNPDRDGDGVVNLTDLTAFSTDYYSGSYRWRSDFNLDGLLNLSDIPVFSSFYGESCQ